MGGGYTAVMRRKRPPTRRPAVSLDEGPPLTPREREVLAAYALTGSRVEAAAWCGISHWTVRQTLTEVYLRLDVVDALSAMRAVGWLRVPVGAWPAAPFPFDRPPPRRKGWRRRRTLES